MISCDEQQVGLAGRRESQEIVCSRRKQRLDEASDGEEGKLEQHTEVLEWESVQFFLSD